MNYNLGRFIMILNPFNPEKQKDRDPMKKKLEEMAGAIAKTILKLKRYLNNSFHGCISPEFPF